MGCALRWEFLSARVSASNEITAFFLEPIKPGGDGTPGELKRLLGLLINEAAFGHCFDVFASVVAGCVIHGAQDVEFEFEVRPFPYAEKKGIIFCRLLLIERHWPKEGTPRLVKIPGRVQFLLATLLRGVTSKRWRSFMADQVESDDTGITILILDSAIQAIPTPASLAELLGWGECRLPALVQALRLCLRRWTAPVQSDTDWRADGRCY